MVQFQLTREMVVTSTSSEAIETLVDNLRKLTLEADAFPSEDIDGLNKMI